MQAKEAAVGSQTTYGNELSGQFSGQYFLITGGSQGLGEATARLFAERGAAGLVICGRDVAKGEAVANSISDADCPTHFVSAELAQVDDCLNLVAQTDRLLPRLHGVVNCAGYTGRGGLLNTGEAQYNRFFDVNTRAPFYIMQAAAKLMIRDGIEGSIVNISSISAHGGQSFLTAYVGSKAALNAISKNAAFSLMRNRIRVNVLNIGWMDSPGEHKVQALWHDAPEDWLAAVESREPFGRLVKPEEVARAAAFLCGEESGLMTGAVIDLDQGVIGCGDGRNPQPDQAAVIPKHITE